MEHFKRKKNYYCCICHIELENHPIRLCEFKREQFAYKQSNKYDFCNDCFKKFRGWILKNKEK